MRVAYFVPGSFTHTLSTELFPPGSDWVQVANANEVFSAIEDRRADKGVVPYYNSFATTDGIPFDYDLLGKSASVYVEYATDRRIRLCLAALPGTELGAVRTVFLMPVTHPQSRDYLEQFLPSANLIKQHAGRDISSTRHALELAKESGTGSAGVGPIDTATALGLSILAPKIENEGNITSFLVLGYGPPSPRGPRRMLFLSVDASLTEEEAVERIAPHFPPGIILYQWAVLPSRMDNQTERFVLVEADTAGNEFPYIDEEVVKIQRNLGNGHPED